MNILHVIATLDPDFGGPPQVAARLAAAQAALGHGVEILHYAQPAADGRIQQMMARIPGVEKVGLRTIRRPGRIERLLGREARRAMGQALVGKGFVHFHCVWESIHQASAAEARRRGVPYAITPHGMLDPWSLAQRKWKKKLALALGRRTMLSRAAFLHVLNQAEGDLMAPLRLAAPAQVIPNGVFLNEIEPLPPAGTFRNGRDELKGMPYLLFLGRVHYKKGLDHLVDAFAMMKRPDDLHLVIAGPDDGAGADVRSRIERHGLAARAHLVGPLYGPDKLAALADAQAFCLTSRQEGFSVAVIEAMACRTPVLISPHCHFDEAAAEGAGVVVENEPAQIARALERLAADDTNRRTMGEKGRALVENKYLWPKIAERCVGVYQKHGAAPG